MRKLSHTHICQNCSIQFMGKKKQRFCCKSCSNIWAKGRLNVGMKRSVETRALIGLAAKGRKDSIETTLKRSLSHRGLKHYRWNSNRDEQLLKNKLGHFCRKVVERALKGDPKEGRSFALLGYTPVELRNHLESLFEPWMNWSNWGRGPGTWQIDHIRLLSSFPKGTTPAVINALSNLRPLSYEQNMARPKFERVS